MLGLGLGARALDHVVQVERPVARQHDDRAEPTPEELAERRADARVHELRRERERERQVERAGREVHRGQHHAAALRRGAQAESVRLEPVDAGRQVLAVELERADRQVRERRLPGERAQLRRSQTLVASLDRLRIVGRHAGDPSLCDPSAANRFWNRLYESILESVCALTAVCPRSTLGPRTGCTAESGRTNTCGGDPV